MSHHKFDVKKLDKLNNPKRVDMIDLDKIINELNLPLKATLVDVGAGTGIFSEQLLNLIPASICYSLDISIDMINWIKENRIAKLNNRLDAVVMEESKIPLANNIADLAFMITVHHELENPIDLLNDVSRILKSDGKILICDWKEGAHHHFVPKQSIIDDLINSDFKNIKEIDASENLVCIIASKH